METKKTENKMTGAEEYLGGNSGLVSWKKGKYTDLMYGIFQWIQPQLERHSTVPLVGQ